MKKYITITLYVLFGIVDSLPASQFFPEPTFQDSTVRPENLEQQAYSAYLNLINSATYQHADPEEQYLMIAALAHPLGMTIERLHQLIYEAEQKHTQPDN